MNTSTLTTKHPCSRLEYLRVSRGLDHRELGKKTLIAWPHLKLAETQLSRGHVLTYVEAERLCAVLNWPPEDAQSARQALGTPVNGFDRDDAPLSGEFLDAVEAAMKAGDVS